MDYPSNQSDFNREVMRRLAEMERQQAQFFSKYQPQINHRQNPRLARTLEEFDENDDSTYPEQGASNANLHFPVVFLSGGHLNENSSTGANFTAHDETSQNFVFSLTHNWIPPSTVIEVWHDVGTDTDYPGFWWTVFRDPIRLGVTKTGIDNMANGTVDEYDSNDYREETEVIREWRCRNWCGYDLEANTPVFFSQRRGVAYIINAACAAAGSGFGSGL